MVLGIEQLLAGLEQRRMRYLVQVPYESAAPLFDGEGAPRPGGVGRPVATMKWWDAGNDRTFGA